MTEVATTSERSTLPGNAESLELPLALSFACYGGQFVANAEDSPDGAVISVEGIVGKIPFSAESPEARANLRQMLSQRPTSEIVWLERDGRNRVVLRGQAPLGDNPNRAGVVAALSAMLSAGKPLLDILTDCGAYAPAIANDSQSADSTGAN